MAIHCKYCCGEISCREDLVVATNLFRVNTYHGGCYSKILNTSQSGTLGEPINSTRVTLWAIIGPVLSLVLFFINTTGREALYTKLLGIALIVPAIYRFYSWYKFEREL